MGRTFTLRLPISLPSKYPTRVWFLGGGGFTPEEEGLGKVRGQSVDITTKSPDHSNEVWAFSCLGKLVPGEGLEPTHPLR